MRFLLDHDVPNEVAQVLKYVGHEVTLVREVLSLTTEDAEIFDYARSERLILVTCNRDHFISLARKVFETQPSQPSSGLVILVRRRTRQSECAHLLALLQRAGETGLCNNINFA